MSLPWQLLTATDIEEQALLNAAAGNAVSPPGHYYAGVSTTLPTKAGAYTELSGNGYAAVQIPAWAGAGTFGSSDYTVIDADYPSPYFTVWAATPLADVVFPDPTGAWWSGGATVWLILKDAASGGSLRWWAPIAPAVAPGVSNPLTIQTGKLLIGIARQDAGEGIVGVPGSDAARTVGVIAGETFAKALDKMTGHDPTYAPSWYLAVGWGQLYDPDGNPLAGQYVEPGNPAGVSAGYNVAVRGLDSAGGEITSAISNTRDADYVRKAISWSAPASDADGWFIANASDIVWTLGDNTVVSGDPIPPGPILGDQLEWTTSFYELGRGDVGASVLLRGGRANGLAFSLWQQASGGMGGVPPSLLIAAFDPTVFASGLKDDGGDIWGYPYAPALTMPDPLPAKLGVVYTYLDESEIISVSPGPYSGTFEVNMPYPYTTHYFSVIYEQQADGSFKDPTSGDIWDPARLIQNSSSTGPDFGGWVAWGTVFPPDSTHGGAGYYVVMTGIGIHYVANAAQYNDSPRRFVVGDTVQVDAGAIKIRLR